MWSHFRDRSRAACFRRVDYPVVRTENSYMSNNYSTASIFTLGYEGMNIDEFIQKLKANSVNVLIDVRKNAISRKPGFSKTRFSQMLSEQNIDYYHLPDLGIPSSHRKHLDMRQPSTYESLFDMYEAEILPKATDSIKLVREIAEKKRVALTCFESDHRFCHRSSLSHVVANQGATAKKVLHI